MAKYCFYCGQELAPGEKCKCRNAAGTSSSKETKRSRSAPNTQAGGKGETPKSAKTDSSSGPRIRKSFKEKASRPVFRFRTFSDQLRTLFPTFTSGVISCAGYILRPAAKIRQESLRARRPFSIVNIAVFCVLTGVLAVLLVYSGSRLFSGMMDSIIGETARAYCANHPAIALGALTVLTLVFVLVLTLCFYISSRVGNRKPTFRKTLDLVSISLIYVQIPEFILLVSILLGGRSSVSFLFISLILIGLAQLLAFRNALGLSEDAIFLMILFAYSLTYLIGKLLLFILLSIFFPA